jgi:hypothetical protein
VISLEFKWQWSLLKREVYLNIQILSSCFTEKLDKSGNVSAFNSESVLFKDRPGQDIDVNEDFLNFLQSCQSNVGIVPQIASQQIYGI